jgi:RimJ/RimL family protein N-acetyltransferase
MNIVWSGFRSPERNEVVGGFVASLIGFERGFEKFATMGVFDGNKLIAGSVYHNWQPEAGVVEISSASISRRWLTKPVIKAMFSFPFDKLGCQLVVLRVSERNEVMCGIAERFGFQAYPIPRLRGRDEGEIIFTLTVEQWRGHRVHALGGKNG